MREDEQLRFEDADLAAYLDRMDCSGPVAADLATLRSLQAHHLAAIAFENLDPLFHRTPGLTARSLMEKLVHGARGGYCYEQNGLLLGMLQHIGFDATGLIGRVRWGVSPEVATPRSHMTIHVALPEGPYLVDVGFGGMTPTGPLQLTPDVAQETPHEPFRLLRKGPDWLLQALVAGSWSDVYEFDLTPQIPIDYHASNYFLANSDESFFTRGVIAARHVPGRRLALNDRQFTIYPTGKPPERHTLRDAGEICDALESHFGIRPPDRSALVARIEARASSRAST